MADPSRARNIAGAVFLASIAALLGARAMPKESVGHGWHLALMITGMACAPISGIWMLIAWSDSRAYRRLKAGVGVLARWKVDAARWAWFREQSQEWDKRPKVGPNLVRLDQPCGPAGIEIVVTREALLVGEHFVSFEPNVSFKAYPGWVDIFFTIYKQKGRPMPINLRIPLPPGPDGDRLDPQLVEGYLAAVAAKSPYTITKGKFLIIFFVGLPVLLGVLVLLAMLLRRE